MRFVCPWHTRHAFGPGLKAEEVGITIFLHGMKSVCRLATCTYSFTHLWYNAKCMAGCIAARLAIANTNYGLYRFVRVHIFWVGVDNHVQGST